MRTAIVAPPWSAPPAGAAAPARTDPRPLAAAVAPAPSAKPERGAEARPAGTGSSTTGMPIASVGASRPRLDPGRVLPLTQPAGGATQATRVSSGPFPPTSPAGFAPPPSADLSSAGGRRWSLSAWSFVRRGRGQPLAGGGLLGGSQAGARFTYRLNADPRRPISLSARLSAPLGNKSGAEAALGIEWRPSRRVPVQFLAERRQAIGREGRSAFGLTVHGGVSDASAGPFRIDAYGQAGLVGARSRDAFADGSMRLSIPLGTRVRIGAGAWAAAQPGVARVDLGPQAAIRATLAGRPVTFAADWRLRVAGEAEPGSGPTLTVATEF